MFAALNPPATSQHQNIVFWIVLIWWLIHTSQHTNAGHFSMWNGVHCVTVVRVMPCSNARHCLPYLFLNFTEMPQNTILFISMHCTWCEPALVP